jgi:hypothetical protein
MRVYWFGWKFAIRVPKFGIFGEFLTRNVISYQRSPQKHFLTANRVVWAITVWAAEA